MNRRLRKYGGKWGKRRETTDTEIEFGSLSIRAAASFAPPRKPPASEASTVPVKVGEEVTEAILCENFQTPLKR